MKKQIIVIGILAMFLLFNITVLPAIGIRTVETKKLLTLKENNNYLTMKELPFNERWFKIFEGDGLQDRGNCVQQTNDGGYIVVGNFFSYSNYNNDDVWLIKTDEHGEIIWERTWDDGEGWPNHGNSVQQTSDGGYIITGYGASENHKGDVWLIKTDSSGYEVWNKTYGYGRYHMDEGYSVKQTMDGGYIITGFHQVKDLNFDVLLIKIDSNGNEEWNKTWGGDDWDVGHSVLQTSDGGYIIAAETHSYGPGHHDIWLIKTDSNGNEEWNNIFGGEWGDVGYSIQQTTDGGFIITGCGGPRIDLDVWLIKTDENGNMEWNKIFGNVDFHECAFSVQQTIDGGYILAGDKKSTFFKDDIWLIKTDSYGNEMWNRTIGGHNVERARSVQQTKDGGYIITGYITDSPARIGGQVVLIKTDENGKVSEPPQKPSAPKGSKLGKTEGEYIYKSSTKDPEGDQIYYLFDWGDGTEKWVGPYDSGETASTSHIWNIKGEYEIRVKTKDKYGTLSEWSDPLSVTMPKSKTINKPFLSFLEQHPIRYQLLQRLLKL